MGEGLSNVFSFWLTQLVKFIDLLKKIPVFENVSLFQVIIALGLIAIFIKLIKYGFHFKAIHSSTSFPTSRSYTSERRE